MALPSSKISPLGNYRQQPTGTWISTKAFNTELFSYSTYQNSSFQTIGNFAANTSATTANCPAGRILHANGKLLLPGVNPNVTKPYIGVYDAATGLNGYIDPTSPTFAKYDVNLPAQYDLGGADATNAGGALAPYLAGQGAKINVNAAPFAIFVGDTLSSSTSLTVDSVTKGVIRIGMTLYSTDGASLTGTRTITAQTAGTTGGAGTYTLSGNAAGTGTDVTIYGAVNGTSSNPLNVSAGVLVTDGVSPTVVWTSVVTQNSLVFLTQIAGTAAATVVTVSDGSFSVAGASIGAYNYLIIN